MESRVDADAARSRRADPVQRVISIRRGSSGFGWPVGAAIPLHHIGGRGEAGFDLVWNLQPGWLAGNLGTPGSGIVAIDPYPSNNVMGASSNSYALGGPGSVFVRTGASWQSCGSTYAVGSTITNLVFNAAPGSQITLTDTAAGAALSAAPSAGVRRRQAVPG